MRKLNVNGKTVEYDGDEDKPLLWALREDLGLTGAKYGCGISQCGACTVHIDGQAVRTCTYPVGALEGSEKITTIEGLSEDGSLPLRNLCPGPQGHPSGQEEIIGERDDQSLTNFAP